ncbi:MAG: ABC transporter permease [Nitrososphaerota archaeon]|nr:ABC transporter permease [Nitrososphaerota archaeon]
MNVPFIEPRKIWALTKRDIHNWTSYKSQIITTTIGGVVGVATWGVNSTYVNRPVPEYGTNYLSFLMVGILITNLIMPLSQGLQSRLNPWTLENILMTGIRSTTLVIGTAAWTYIVSVLLFIPELIIAFAVFHVSLDINVFSLVLAIMISSTIVFSLAMISTGLRIVTKVSDPVTYAITLAASLLSGMTFPVDQLNHYLPGLSTVSWFLPQTWIYHIVRLSALENSSILSPGTGEAFAITFCIGIFLLYFSAQIFRWGLRRAKREATLSWY